MAGDLEDFLRRAAERRAQKQQQGAGGGAGARPAAKPRPQAQRPVSQRPVSQRPAAPRPKPEYTEAKRERLVRPPVEEPVPGVELAQQPIGQLAEKRERAAKAKKKAAESRERVAQQQRDIHEPTAADRGVISIAGGSPIEQLLDLMRRPGGIQQAFLLREILERPEERWK